MSEDTVELPLDDTMAKLIVEIVGLRAQVKILRAYTSVLSKVVNPKLEGALEKQFEEIYYSKLIDELDLTFPELSDGWRTWILNELQKPND